MPDVGGQHITRLSISHIKPQLGQRFEIEATEFCLRLQLQTLQSSALGVETVVTTPPLPCAAQRHHDPHHPGTASVDQLAVALLID